MKARVACTVNYIYECEIPDNVEDIVEAVQDEDPIWIKIGDLCEEYDIPFEGRTDSILDLTTDKMFLTSSL